MLTYIRQAWLVLLLGLLFGVALAGVNTWLSPKIDENQRIARQNAALAVIENSAAAKTVQIKLDDQTTVTVYRITGEDGTLLGWAATASGQGYGDTIKLIVGVDAEATTITDFRVIYNQETPGLGNKIIEGGFRKRFRDKSAREPLQAVNKANPADEEIQALTGATISSQAVCDIIFTQLNKKNEAKQSLLDLMREYKPDTQTTDTEN